MLTRRNLFKSAGATALGVAMAGVTHAGIAPASDLEPREAGSLRALTMALARAPRRRHFKTVPMILTDPTDWDHHALDLVLRYRGGLRQVWDNTVLTSPWLNLMRNAMNTQVWSFRHPDFLCVSATHGSAHLALYDNYIWQRYQFRKLTKNQFTDNTFLGEPPAARANPRAYEDADGVYSPHDNSITVLQRRGAVFLACHNAVWELTMKLHKNGINPGHLRHEEMAAEFTNHLIAGVVLTPGIVGTLPELERAGFQYAK
ncbi:MAG: thiosulfate dehydrogenase [Acidiferrobacter sp.]